MDENFPCKCGHLQIFHVNLAEACYPCLEDYLEFGLQVSICVKFHSDNLKYLEQKHNQKILNEYKVTKEKYNDKLA